MTILVSSSLLLIYNTVMQDEQPRENPPPSTEAAWQFRPEGADASTVTVPQSPDDAVRWTASEYIAHHKSYGWFMGYGFVLGLIALLIYVFTRGDFVSTVMVFIIGVAFGIFAGRQPRELNYAVDPAGVRIGSRSYPYASFKSFSVIEEDPIRSINLLPLKRFMPPISIYYDPEDEEKIISTLSLHLPFEEKDHDFVERLMRRVRF